MGSFLTTIVFPVALAVFDDIAIGFDKIKNKARGTPPNVEA
jgi:hypothetical protein